MLLSKNLRAERKKLDISAKELAKRVGVSRSYITLIENGKRLPGKTLLPKIARALNLKKNLVIEWYLSDLKEKLKC